MYKNMDTDGYGHEDDRLNKEQGGDWNKNDMGKGGMPSEKTSLTPEKSKKPAGKGEKKKD